MIGFVCFCLRLNGLLLFPPLFSFSVFLLRGLLSQHLLWLFLK